MSGGVVFGIDVGTTSVAGVAVDAAGRVLASVTRAHSADIVGFADGVDEQDPAKLVAAVDAVRDELTARAGSPARIGWTGQMHGVVGVDAQRRPVTNFVTWRDARRFGGVVMAQWVKEGRAIHRCLPVCALAAGVDTIDATFLHAWYLDLVQGEVPPSWLPRVEEGAMLGDNQAGVFAAQALHPGCAVVNLGTSGQLSVVRERPFAGPSLPGKAAPDGSRTEFRPYPGGRTLECRASMIGGGAWAALRTELGVSWEEMNAAQDVRTQACARRIADDLFGDLDLTGVSCLVGVGNALVRNPALRRAVEARAGMSCVFPSVPEMAAYGAALV